jgi:SAM-dependent methyltransferase
VTVMPRASDATVTGGAKTGDQSQLYTTRFFENVAAGVERSAEVIVPMVVDLIQPRSVVDVGCGAGHWLSVFMQKGIADIVGVDGGWIEPALLKIPGDRFLTRDLSQPLRLSRQFDLVVCLEVGEHLPAAAADGLADSLASLGPVILFSAAIPQQGGVGHINEQWPEYWRARFEKRGFEVLDCVRRRVWDDERVEAYYAQNIFLYVRRDRLPVLEGARLRGQEALPLTVVHPKVYRRSLEVTDPANIGLRAAIRALPIVAGKAMRRRVRNITKTLQSPERRSSRRR